MTHTDLTVVLEAAHIRPGNPGRIHRLELDARRLDRPNAMVARGLGEAVEVAWEVNRLAGQLVAYAVGPPTPRSDQGCLHPSTQWWTSSRGESRTRSSGTGSLRRVGPMAWPWHDWTGRARVPLLADPDCAVRGCQPLLRVSYGSFPPLPAHHRNRWPTRADRPRCGGNREEPDDMTTALHDSAARPAVRPWPALLTFLGGVGTVTATSRTAPRPSSRTPRPGTWTTTRTRPGNSTTNGTRSTSSVSSPTRRAG